MSKFRCLSMFLVQTTLGSAWALGDIPLQSAQEVRYQCSFNIDSVGPAQRDSRVAYGDIFVAGDGSDRSLGLEPINGSINDAQARVWSYSLSNGKKRVLLNLTRTDKKSKVRIFDSGEKRLEIELTDVDAPQIPKTLYSLVCTLKESE